MLGLTGVRSKAAYQTATPAYRSSAVQDSQPRLYAIHLRPPPLDIWPRRGRYGPPAGRCAQTLGPSRGRESVALVCSNRSLQAARGAPRLPGTRQAPSCRRATPTARSPLAARAALFRLASRLPQLRRLSVASSQRSRATLEGNSRTAEKAHSRKLSRHEKSWGCETPALATCLCECL